MATIRFLCYHESVTPQRYREFLLDFLHLLQELAGDSNAPRDAKFYCQLRTAERTFNFLLDNFPLANLHEVFTTEEWHKIKNDRDELAAKIAAVIKDNPETAKRYKDYCDLLKDPEALGFML
jgi:hypothetical protein